MWNHIANKLRNIPEYVDMFKAAYPNDITQTTDITYVHAANAIAAFEAVAWRFDNSPFHRYPGGDHKALSDSQKAGMRSFYDSEKANCASCHSGAFQTDHDFHAIAMPQIGPRKGDNLDDYTDNLDDFGRERVTADITDRFKFRTPTLSNIALTAPYGDEGAYDTLEAIVDHHLDPTPSLFNYDQSQAVLPSRTDLDQIDFVVMDDNQRLQSIAETNELQTIQLSPKRRAQLLIF